MKDLQEALDRIRAIVEPLEDQGEYVDGTLARDHDEALCQVMDILLEVQRGAIAPTPAPSAPSLDRITATSMMELVKSIFDAPTMEAGYAILKDWAWQCGHGVPVALRGSSPSETTGPLARVDYPDGEWLPRMWDLALASSDHDEVGSTLTLKAVAASHGYQAVYVQQEVPDELADETTRVVLEQVSPPTDAPVEGVLVGRTMDEDGIMNWYCRPADRAALQPEGQGNG